MDSDPTFAIAYNYLGTTLKKGEQIEVPRYKEPLGAKELFLKAIEFDPIYATAYKNLGQTLKAGFLLGLQFISPLDSAEQNS